MDMSIALSSKPGSDRSAGPTDRAEPDGPGGEAFAAAMSAAEPQSRQANNGAADPADGRGGAARDSDARAQAAAGRRDGAPTRGAAGEQDDGAGAAGAERRGADTRGEAARWALRAAAPADAEHVGGGNGRPDAVFAGQRVQVQVHGQSGQAASGRGPAGALSPATLLAALSAGEQAAARAGDAGKPGAGSGAAQTAKAAEAHGQEADPRRRGRAADGVAKVLNRTEGRGDAAVRSGADPAALAGGKAGAEPATATARADAFAQSLAQAPSTPQSASVGQGGSQSLPAAGQGAAAGQGQSFDPVMQTTGPTGQTAGSGGAEAAGRGAAAQTAARFAPAAPPSEQVAVQLGRAAANGQQQVQIRLSPAELGRIDVKLEVRDDGVVRAVLAVDKPETLELMQRDPRALEKALQDAGLKTDDGSLNFNLRGDGQGGDGSGGDRDGRDARAPGRLTGADDATETDARAQAPGAAGRSAAGDGRVDLRV